MKHAAERAVVTRASVVFVVGWLREVVGHATFS